MDPAVKPRDDNTSPLPLQEHAILWSGCLMDPAVKPRDDNFYATRDENTSPSLCRNLRFFGVDASRSLPRHVFSRDWHDTLAPYSVIVETGLAELLGVVLVAAIENDGAA